MRFNTFGIFVVFFFGTSSVWAEAGRFQFVYGDVSITRAKGETVAAHKGDSVEEGDFINTGALAQAQLLMSDNGLIAMRPDSRMRIEIFRFSGKTDGTEQGVYSLLKGGFRAITGLIGSRNKDSYKIRTATATIGIRGTDHDVLYIAPPLAGEKSVGPPGTYDKVNVGSTYLETPAGRLELSGNQVGFAPALGNIAPTRLPSIPDFLKSTPAIRQTAKNDAQSGGGATNTATSSTGSDASTTTATTSDSSTASSTDTASTDTSLASSTTTTTSNTATSTTTAAPTVALITPTPTGVFNPANPTIGSLTAPNGTVLAGGGVGSQGVNSGAGVIGDPLNSLSMLVDATGAPLTVVADKFKYNRNGAPYVMSGNDTSLTGQKVQWGIYDGGAMVDNGVTYTNPKFFWMTSTSATTTTNILAALPISGTSTLTFSSVGGFTTPITESGTVGGSVSPIPISSTSTSTFPVVRIANLGGVPSIDLYKIQVSDALSRTWTGVLSNSQSLASFMTGSNQNLSVNCSGTACAASTGSGNAQGAVIGNPTPVGMVSSYKLSAGTSSVAGAVLAK